VILHGYTGAVDFVEMNAAEAIRTGNFDLLLPNDFQTLVKRGYITTKTILEMYINPINEIVK
jgi:hypothetical protein